MTIILIRPGELLAAKWVLPFLKGPADGQALSIAFVGNRGG